MGYRHIDNLYKNKEILVFKEVYALEKVHGTSAHVRIYKEYKKASDSTDASLEKLDDKIPFDVKFHYFSGGATHDTFKAIFDEAALKQAFIDAEFEDVTFYGEAYGGKMQGMRDTYGDKLMFIVFDVLSGGLWRGVEQANWITNKMNLEFVPWNKVSTDIASLDAERDLPSRVAVRRGITEPKISEGVVLRPPIEVGYAAHGDKNFGRIMVKHKRPEFSERTSKKDTKVEDKDPTILVKAKEIAEEWVTPMRMDHVLDKLRAETGKDPEIKDTGTVINRMKDDVVREGKGEIEFSQEAFNEIAKKAREIFHTKLRSA